MKFSKNIVPKSIVDIASACPGCPACSIYSGCYCSFLGKEIVDEAFTNWAKCGQKVSAAIDNSADASGVAVPWRL